MGDFQIRFEPLTSVDDPRWGFVEGVFSEAFPPDERREFELQRRLAVEESRFTQCVVFDGERLVGVISYWRLGVGNYLEHIATTAGARGGGLGAAIICHLIDTVASEWFGEVELPSDEMSRRRVGFYERLGFVGYPELPYVQPSYGEGKGVVAMMVMAVGGMRVDEGVLLGIVEEMAQTVYRAGLPPGGVF